MGGAHGAGFADAYILTPGVHRTKTTTMASNEASIFHLDHEIQCCGYEVVATTLHLKDLKLEKMRKLMTESLLVPRTQKACECRICNGA